MDNAQEISGAFTLRKREDRGKFRMNEIASLSQRVSAKWEVREMPGLILLQSKDKLSHLATPPVWSFFNIHLPYDEHYNLEILLEDLDSKYHAGVLAYSKLKAQKFTTRKDALQALKIALLY